MVTAVVQATTYTIDINMSLHMKCKFLDGLQAVQRQAKRQIHPAADASGEGKLLCCSWSTTPDMQHLHQRPCPCIDNLFLLWNPQTIGAAAPTQACR
jgi:hypothetical protein